MDFPYGKAPLAILCLMLISGAILFAVNVTESVQRKPDLMMVTFAKEHADAYKPAIAKFERDNNVKIQIQVVDKNVVNSRLQAAFQAGADVPDMVEILTGTMGTFTRGPLDDVGFLDLTERVKEAHLDQRLVQSRFRIWSSRGHIFALPHDVHPTGLIYLRDRVEELGIDVNKLTTWDEFTRIGREITRDLDGDGVPDRYMIDLPPDGSDALRLLLLQRGVGLFNEKEEVTFDDERSVDVVCWYVRQIQGKNRISVTCGWGQTLSRAMIDGRCLFYMCPDWRTMQIQADIPSLAGKLAVMPLPAWEKGGIRTSTWGGTGLAITKQCKNPDLAWKLAMYLYYDADQLGPRFAATNILPPLKEAWSRPEFDQPKPFFSNQKLGRIYSALAPDVPAEVVTAHTSSTTAKLSEAFTNTSLYYQEHGEDGLRDFARSELKRCADRAREIVRRNRFLNEPPAASRTESSGAANDSIRKAASGGSVAR
jgi:arabinosaccharide transport system substrate-binding protein